jgi:hypothetical protein
MFCGGARVLVASRKNQSEALPIAPSQRAQVTKAHA